VIGSRQARNEPRTISVLVHGRRVARVSRFSMVAEHAVSVSGTYICGWGSHCGGALSVSVQARLGEDVAKGEVAGPTSMEFEDGSSDDDFKPRVFASVVTCPSEAGPPPLSAPLREAPETVVRTKHPKRLMSVVQFRRGSPGRTALELFPNGRYFLLRYGSDMLRREGSDFARELLSVLPPGSAWYGGVAERGLFVPAEICSRYGVGDVVVMVDFGGVRKAQSVAVEGSVVPGFAVDGVSPVLSYLGRVAEYATRVETSDLEDRCAWHCQTQLTQRCDGGSIFGDPFLRAAE
jgi:hypothetical protein